MNSRLALACLVVGVLLVSNSFYMTAKASLAQYLIAYSWENRPAGRGANVPWPWADTRPVARLVVPRLGVDQFVMQDASGESLAFGPGLVNASSFPEAHKVIAGHRDSHFDFMRRLKSEDLIRIENSAGQVSEYVVDQIEVLDLRTGTFVVNEISNRLSLITCYPFDAMVPGGPLRLVAHAVEKPVVGDS